MKSILTKIFFVAVLAGALFLVLNWRERVQNNDNLKPVDGNIQDSNMDTVVAVHTYSNGTHTLKGTLNLPTPCHTLKTEAVVAKSMPEQVKINFTITEPEAGTFCTQVIDERPFQVDFKASPRPIMSAFINGKQASFVIEDQSGTLTPTE